MHWVRYDTIDELVDFGILHHWTVLQLNGLLCNLVFSPFYSYTGIWVIHCYDAFSLTRLNVMICVLVRLYVRRQFVFNGILLSWCIMCFLYFTALVVARVIHVHIRNDRGKPLAVSSSPAGQPFETPLTPNIRFPSKRGGSVSHEIGQRVANDFTGNKTPLFEGTWCWGCGVEKEWSS